MHDAPSVVLNDIIQTQTVILEGLLKDKVLELRRLRLCTGRMSGEQLSDCMIIHYNLQQYMDN